jgi:hypothetical protein
VSFSSSRFLRFVGIQISGLFLFPFCGRSLLFFFCTPLPLSFCFQLVLVISTSPLPIPPWLCIYITVPRNRPRLYMTLSCANSPSTHPSGFIDLLSKASAASFTSILPRFVCIALRIYSHLVPAYLIVFHLPSCTVISTGYTSSCQLHAYAVQPETMMKLQADTAHRCFLVELLWLFL